MAYKLERPAADFDSGQGLVLLEHFQMAYVTNDMAAARELFQRHLGVGDFATLAGDTPGGGRIEAAFTWVGSIMYELICPAGPGTDIFLGHLPETDSFVLRHHHLGYLVQNQAQWDAVIANAERAGFPVLGHNSNALVEYCFVEAPELGHYLEYLFASEAGMDFFNSVPRS